MSQRDVTRHYLVTGYVGAGGGLSLRAFRVRARNQSEAKRRISRSTLGYDRWAGERIRRLEATRWESRHDLIGGVIDAS